MYNFAASDTEENISDVHGISPMNSTTKYPKPSIYGAFNVACSRPHMRKTTHTSLAEHAAIAIKIWSWAARSWHAAVGRCFDMPSYHTAFIVALSTSVYCIRCDAMRCKRQLAFMLDAFLCVAKRANHADSFAPFHLMQFIAQWCVRSTRVFP